MDVKALMLYSVVKFREISFCWKGKYRDCFYSVILGKMCTGLWYY